MAAPIRTWVLADDRPGNANQALGVAEALQVGFEVKPIRYRSLAALPNAVLGASLSGLTPESRAALQPPWPDLVVAAGRRTAPVVRWLKKHHRDLFTVQLMWPGGVDGLDLVVLPDHDRDRDGTGTTRIVRTLGAPHRWTRQRLDQEAEAISARLEDLPQPRITCLVGGTSRHGRFEADDAERLADLLDREARHLSGSLLITTSRRTGPACEEVLSSHTFAVPVWLHRYGSARQAGTDNPYAGFLGIADRVVVTADSASMLSEACATGRPVFVFDPGFRLPPKLARLQARLRDEGRIVRLGESWHGARPCPLVPQEAVAAAVWDELRARGHGT